MEEYLKELNEEQYEAATTIDGPLLILAGAGSGKTKTLIHRVAYMVDNGIPPESILLLTFTNRAAEEMKERAKAMLTKRGKQCNIEASTFHSFCAKMLRAYGKHCGIDPNFKIITSSEEADAINFVKAELKFQYMSDLPPAKTIVSYISTSVNKCVPFESVIPNKYRMQANTIIKIKDALADYKVKNGYMNFDDILIQFINVLQSNESVRSKIENTYAYIMVDEYQDTNIPQDEILSLLRRNNRNIAVVGDDMQSIYGFRGAEVQNIIKFPQRMKGAKTIKLDTNYRSTQGILDVSNCITKCATEGFKKQLKSARGNGITPVLVHTDDQMEEADVTLRLIKQLHNRNGIPYDDICVLARQSSHFASLETALEKARIPYEKRGGAKFMDKAAIQDVLAFLRVVTKPHDQLAWFRILQVIEGVGSIHASEISKLCADYGFDGVLADATGHKGSAYVSNTLDFMNKAKELSNLDWELILPQAINYYLQVRTDAVKHMRTSNEGNRAKEFDKIAEAREDLQVLSDLAAGYQSLNAFLDDIALDNNVSPDSEGSQLILSTVHSSKGLEFKAVILLGCMEGLFPNQWVKYGSKEENEELRCFYVAATRAKDILYFMVPEYVQSFGKTINGNTTRYLKYADGRYGKRCLSIQSAA